MYLKNPKYDILVNCRASFLYVSSFFRIFLAKFESRIVLQRSKLITDGIVKFRKYSFNLIKLHLNLYLKLQTRKFVLSFQRKIHYQECRQDINTPSHPPLKTNKQQKKPNTSDNINPVGFFLGRTFLYLGIHIVIIWEMEHII